MLAIDTCMRESLRHAWSSWVDQLPPEDTGTNGSRCAPSGSHEKQWVDRAQRELLELARLDLDGCAWRVRRISTSVRNPWRLEQLSPKGGAIYSEDFPDQLSANRALRWMLGITMKISRCQACNAEIIWALTGRGKRAPFDAEPVTMMTLDPEARSDGTPVATSVSAYRSHFATCPAADKFRRRRN